MNEPEAILVRHYCVEGRVQGVGFRWFVQQEAATLSLLGKVRNTPHGSVEVLASGTAQALSAFRAKLEQGSRGSRVDRVTEEDVAADAAVKLEAFTIEGAW